MIKKLGWKPGIEIANAPRFGQQVQALAVLPESVDLRPQCGPNLVQGNLGSCTAHAIADTCWFAMKKAGKSAYTPSRLFIYYNERALEGTINSDSGASLSDGVRVLLRQGAPHESLWWYNTVKYKVKPCQTVYADGLPHLGTNILSIDNTNITELKNCLALGYPFVIGIEVFNGIMSTATEQTGVIPMPGSTDHSIGGHAMSCVGYADSHQWFIVRNWWGADWGDQGYGYIPYAYLTSSSLASDFWTIRNIS